MKIHTRQCVCGLVLENTRTRSELCAACTKLARDEAKFAEDRKLLDVMYINVVGPRPLNQNGKREWTFTHEPCGFRQTWVIGNIKSRLKADPDHAPCSQCGKHRK